MNIEIPKNKIYKEAKIIGAMIYLIKKEEGKPKRFIPFHKPSEEGYATIGLKNNRLQVNFFNQNGRLTHSGDFSLAHPPQSLRLRRRARGKADRGSKRKHAKTRRPKGYVEREYEDAWKNGEHPTIHFVDECASVG